MLVVAVVILATLGLSVILRIPIAFSMGIASLTALLIQGDIPLVVIPQRLVVGLDSFALMSIPFFIFAGELMNQGGITRKILDFSNSIVGRFRGGLGLTNIVASMIFGGVSGSMIADTSALGTILIPAMKEKGYDSDFSAAVTAASSICGPVIPPSIPMVVFGVTAGVSILKLFLGGIIPGIIIGLALMITSFLISIKRNYPKMAPAGFVDIIRHSIKAIWALMMPVVIIGGLLTGMFTPTEAAVVAVIYALVIGYLIYREITVQTFNECIVRAAKTTGQILIIVTFAKLFAWVLIANNVPQTLTAFFLSFTRNPVLILLMLNGLMLIMGCFMGPIVNMVILIPLVMNTVKTVGINPIHFGVIMTFNLSLGLLTPPFGLSLYIASSIAKISFKRMVTATLPFLYTLLFVLLLITLCPILVVYIPNISSGM